jgi:hypothetical protein
MCRFTHPLAAIGTMSWPDFGLQRRAKTASQGLPGPYWNHPLAETAELDASVGRDPGACLDAGTHYKTLD